jgi:glyoxylate reductase
MPKISITREIPQVGIDYLRSKGYDLNIWPNTLPPSSEELQTFVNDSEGIISMLSDQFSKELLDLLPNLKIISNYAVGYNNIDVKACMAKSIKVSNTPDVLTEATAELTLSLLLAVSRNIIQASKNVEKNQWKTWNPTGFIGKGLKGKTLGIVGPGRIAFAFADKCHKAFDMNVIYYGRGVKENFSEKLKAKKVSLDELLKQSDIVSLHCPLTDETQNLISKDELSKMKKGSILINTARGEIINQKDLENSLPKTQLFGIGLDVTSPEPILRDSPLLKHEKVVILPHIGSANEESRNAMSLLCAKNIEAYFTGSPLLTEVTGQ